MVVWPTIQYHDHIKYEKDTRSTCDGNLDDISRRLDIRRATSMRDLRVRTYATERGAFGITKLYEIEIENSINTYNTLHWKLFFWFCDIRRFYNELKKIKSPLFISFRKESRMIMLRSYFGEKSLSITRLLRLVFQTISELADKIAIDHGAREFLHITDTFCNMEYPQDHRALLTIRQMKSIQDDEICSICLSDEPGLPRVELRCGHTFHESCICVWYYSRLNCPICRQS